MNQKLAVDILAMGAWGALVALGMTPVAEFVAALREILTAVGIYHVTTMGK